MENVVLLREISISCNQVIQSNSIKVEAESLKFDFLEFLLHHEMNSDAEDHPSTPPHPSTSPEAGDGVDYSVYFVTDRLYDSYEEACTWLKQVAMEHMFELAISGHKTIRSRQLKVVYLKCNRGFAYRGKNREGELVAKPNTYTKANQCKFRVKVVERTDGMWGIVAKSTTGYHNHRMYVYSEGHRQLGELTPPMKLKLREMAEVHVKSGNMLHGLHKEFPDSHVNIKQVYNYRSKMKVEDRDGRNAVDQFSHYAKEREYTVFVDSFDDVGGMTHAFAAHPESVRLLLTYPHVICVDCTYKTNKYRFPLLEMVGVTPTNHNFLIGIALLSDETEGSYMWALSRLQDLLGKIEPNAIVTDRELGILKPVTCLFPNSAHLLCTWHINKDVHHRVFLLTGKSKGEADLFKNTTWKNVVEAATENEYVQAVDLMNRAYAYRPSVLEYVSRTWLVHREKFVRCWTNQVRHFGNTTTNRVESQHAVTKDWLQTGRGGIDTLFEKIDGAIDVQLVKIRTELESSISRTPASYNRAPFQHFINNVSHRCLQLVRSEYLRMRKLRNPMETCGCVLRSTHGIPCACQICSAIAENIPFTLDYVDPFWRTLVIGEGVPSADHADQNTRDRQELTELTVILQDGAQLRNVNRYIRRQIYPEDAGFEDPQVKVNVKGRPKGSSSTRRDPSAFEYTQSRGRSRGRSSSRSSGRSSISSVNMPDPDDEWETCVRLFPYSHAMPHFMLQYLTGWHSPVADGNCGFRCVAATCLGSQHNWLQLRRLMIADIQENPTIYQYFYGGDPLYATRGAHDLVSKSDTPLLGPLPEVHMIWYQNHFIRVRFTPECPVPMISVTWFRKRHQSVHGWENPYQSRIEAYMRNVG